ncbi:hypothetical protein GCM10009754_53160 [Amycolatopsis minnesotensis]|uniref:Uncharacterized protein n=1 Tax=Amycolatopsis minnesotensis TaxID=337894 RepID=A0ABN2RNX6_9PSEU
MLDVLDVLDDEDELAESEEDLAEDPPESLEDLAESVPLESPDAPAFAVLADFESERESLR